MRAGRVLRQIVIARIADQVPSLTAVVDNATEGTAYPFASMGPSDWVPADAECIMARDYSLQIDIWHNHTSKGATEDIVDDIATALRGWADTDALTMHPLRVSLVRVMDDPDGQSVHGVIQVEGLVEAD